MDALRRATCLGGIALALLVAQGERPSAQIRSDQPPPTASAPVQRLLNAAAARAESGDTPAGLRSADDALGVARQNGDASGEAYAQRLRALLLTRLARPGDALAAWQATASSWGRVADAPGQIESLGWQVILTFAQSRLPSTEPRPSFQVPPVGQVIAVARADTQRRIATATTLVRLGSALLRLNVIDASLLDAASALAQEVSPESELAATALNNLGRSKRFGAMSTPGQMELGLKHLEQALALRERHGAESLPVAESLHDIGTIANNPVSTVVVPRDRARAALQRALAIRERLAPESYELADTLRELARLNRLQFLGRGPDNVRELLRRAAAIQESLLEGSTRPLAELPAVGEFVLDTWLVENDLRNTLSGTFNELGNSARSQGDLNEARAYYSKALTLSPRRASTGARPTSLNELFVLNSLGAIARDQGDLLAAREYYSQAAALDQRNPLPFELKSAIRVSRELGEIDEARARLEGLLGLREKTWFSAGSDWLVEPLNELGALARDSGDLKKARTYFERALAIADASTSANRHRLMLPVLMNLTRLDRREEDLASAARQYDRTTSVAGELERSLELRDLLELRQIAKAQGDIARARAYEDRLISGLTPPANSPVPETLNTADRLVTLSTVLYERDPPVLDRALEHATRAWAIIRNQARLVVGDEARQAFEAQYQNIGSHLVRMQIAAGQTEAAFTTLEEGRAQALLQFAAERGLARRLAPATAWADYEDAQQASDRAGRTVEAAVQAQARAQLSVDVEREQKSGPAIIDERERVLADARRSASEAQQAYTRARLATEARWGDVRRAIEPMMPAPMDLAAARQLLPQRTLLAAFSVGESDSILFIVGRDGPVTAYALGLTQEELAARVRRVRADVSRERGQRSLAAVADDELRVRASRDLFQKLFPEGARRQMARASGILLLPDRSLWDLPFAALITNEQGTPSYLGLEHSLTLTPSLSMWARLARASLSPLGRPATLIVGNPLFESDSQTGATAPSQGRGQRSAEGEWRVLSRDGDVPEPLPFAADEARQIAALYGSRAATGREPTEEWFRSRAGDADIIHLATHGYFNPFRAASSGLLLAVPPQSPPNGETMNDGALQAWEVMTQLQLRARLVVLSACETGMGTQVPGEGLVGLTRSFLVAGAQSVVATQWKVPDASTSRMMIAFHQRLRAGVARDDAMRRAMQTVAADTATRDPYYWAPFVLVGDSRPLSQARD